MNICELLQQQLLDGDELNSEQREHLAKCPGCQEFKAALTQVDDGLAKPEALDAPDELVESVLAKVSAEDAEETKVPKEPPVRLSWLRVLLCRPSVQATLLFVFGILVFALGFFLFGLFCIAAAAARLLYGLRLNRPQFVGGALATVAIGLFLARSLTTTFGGPATMTFDKIGTPLQEPGTITYNDTRVTETLGGLADIAAGVFTGEAAKKPHKDGVGERQLNQPMASEAEQSVSAKETAPQRRRAIAVNSRPADLSIFVEKSGKTKQDFKKITKSIAHAEETVPIAPPLREARRAARPDSVVDYSLPVEPEMDKVIGHDLEELRLLAGVEAPSDIVADDEIRFAISGGAPPEGSHSTLEHPTTIQQFFNERAKLTSVSFQDPTGYWANTYVPGDATYRRLFAKLQDQSLPASVLPPQANELLKQSQKAAQPFDDPEVGALGLYLSSDKPTVPGQDRILLQVGLKAPDRSSGRRPAMRVGLVFDLRGTQSTESQKRIRSLLDAFQQAKDIGDRFHITVAGKPGGAVIGPEDFRHGPIKVWLQNLSGDKRKGKTLGVAEALETSAELLAGDPDAPLGTSIVVLVSANDLSSDLTELSQIAHKYAVNGVQVSTIALSRHANLDQLDEITLAGQGTRRLLESPADAEQLVQRQLAAASQVVARALRLNIRLAEGVKLIDIPGSYRLSEARTMRAKAAERSLDSRLSRRLGIEMDRGEDDDGIQILVPSFYAGDSHVILLDLVVPGPGKVADVTIRFKDLIDLENRTIRTSFALQRTASSLGPLQLNVMKNFLAQQLSDSLKQASELVRAGNFEQAAEITEQQATLNAAFRNEFPSFQRDQDLQQNEMVLEQANSLLRSRELRTNLAQQEYVADSLRLSGQLQTQKLLTK